MVRIRCSQEEKRQDPKLLIRSRNRLFCVAGEKELFPCKRWKGSHEENRRSCPSNLKNIVKWPQSSLSEKTSKIKERDKDKISCLKSTGCFRKRKKVKTADCSGGLLSPDMTMLNHAKEAIPFDNWKIRLAVSEVIRAKGKKSGLHPGRSVGQVRPVESYSVAPLPENPGEEATELTHRM